MTDITALIQERGRLIIKHAYYVRLGKRKAALMTWVRLHDVTNKILEAWAAHERQGAAA